MNLSKTIGLFGNALMTAAFLLLTPSCLDTEGSSLGDFKVDIATVHVEDGSSYSLILDNGDVFKPVATPGFYKAKEGQRVFVNYTLLPGEKEGYDRLVRINDLSCILTKEVIALNAANADSIGNDPVIVKDMWVGGGYLNVYFLFNYGGVRPHAINLVKNELSPEASSDKVELEFRHNAYGSPHSRLFDGFVCFDLKPFKSDDADSVKISVKVKEWNAEKTIDVVYKYSQAGNGEAALRTFVTPVTSSEEYY